MMKLNQSRFDRLIWIAISLFVFPCRAQLLNEPESIVFDNAQLRYLVSNKGDGKIIQMTKGGQTVFADDQSSIRGLHILGDNLYAASDAGVVGYDLTKGTKALTVAIPGQNFLNDITSVGESILYVTDTGAGKIYKVNPIAGTFTTAVDGLTSPNGIYYDAPNNRLIVCYWRNNSPIDAVSLADANVSTIVNTTFNLLDGIAEDSDGRFYVSCGGTNTVYRYDASFDDPPEVFSTGHDGPADIYVNRTAHLLMVPNLNADSIDDVEIIPLEDPDPDPDPGPEPKPGVVYTVTNTSDDGPGSLRRAIGRAGIRVGSDTVAFNIPQSDANYNPDTGVWTITLESALSVQPDSFTVIDGFTQMLNQGDTNPDGLEIELQGNNTTDYAFWIASYGNLIRGFVINRFAKSGMILISVQCSYNKILYNFIGTDADGLTALPNQAGIEITNCASRNFIGSYDMGNLISGNHQWGVFISNACTRENKVSANQIGTNYDGDAPLGNGYGGVFVGYGAEGNIIGKYNLISGTPESENDLLGNGILIREANGNKIYSNRIGTNRQGTQTVANGRNGIAIIDSRHTMVGDLQENGSNLISGNQSSGILIRGSESDSNRVVGNLIGTDKDGLADLGNEGMGILIDQGAKTNVIGPRNTIQYNGHDGVRVSDDTTRNNTVSQNIISNHAGKGILLYGGSNRNVQPPVLDPDIIGRVSGSTYPSCLVEIYSDQDDEGGIPEAVVTSDADGAFAWNRIATGPNVSAIVTDKFGNTSEFSVIYASVDKKETNQNPATFKLWQNSPNPFNPTTVLRYELPQKSKVDLTIYNFLGQEVIQLVSMEQDVGRYEVEWDASQYPSGMYLCRLETNAGFVATQKIVLMK